MPRSNSRSRSRSRSNSDRKPRDRSKNNQIFVSRFPLRTHAEDLRYFFEKYGRVRDINMKRTFAFIEFSDSRDASKGKFCKFIIFQPLKDVMGKDLMEVHWWFKLQETEEERGLIFLKIAVQDHKNQTCVSIAKSMDTGIILFALKINNFMRIILNKQKLLNF